MHLRCMQKLNLLLLAALGAEPLACTPSENDPVIGETVSMLVRLSEESNAALMRGDIDEYSSLVSLAPNFTLFSPFGGEPTRGALTSEALKRMGNFFKNGTHEQEIVQVYSSPDMVVLAMIERSRVEVGGLPKQDWALRVTLTYRREGNAWQLVHRHADPLVEGVSLPHAATLARGKRPGEGS